ncbi:MAG TPA: hypothetical protein PKH02_00720 [Bacteroidales bacterium]|nr:hypothetical protein [Bacteroidales bacterium]HPT11059.1 hypothetical protein [Bacteroidales bacterium]
MQTEKLDPKPAMMQLKTIYFGLIAGLILFSLVLLAITRDKLFLKANFADIFVIPIVLLMFIIIPVGYYYFQKTLKNLNPDLSVKDKMAAYVPAFLIKIATCEGVCLFSIVCTLITTNIFYMFFFLIAFAVMLSYYPSANKVGNELGLHPSEVDELS